MGELSDYGSSTTMIVATATTAIKAATIQQ
jgi:hypothetical protein